MTAVPLPATPTFPWPARLTRLAIGLALFGVSAGVVLQGNVGGTPWDVLHQGISRHVGFSIGWVLLVSSIFVLLLWIPLRQKPGIGTIANPFLVSGGLALTVAVLPVAHNPALAAVYVVVGVVLNGFATALYIATRLGPGPRDGLMTGLVARTGRSVRLIRTSIEVTVVISGVLLGGTFGVGTIAYALAIGPLVQAFMPYVQPRDHRDGHRDSV